MTFGEQSEASEMSADHLEDGFAHRTPVLCVCGPRLVTEGPRTLLSLFKAGWSGLLENDL